MSKTTMLLWWYFGVTIALTLATGLLTLYVTDAVRAGVWPCALAAALFGGLLLWSINRGDARKAANDAGAE